MITLYKLTEILGWASLFNLGFLVFAVLLIILMKPMMVSLHSKMFGIPEKELNMMYFKYLADYKALSFVFMFSPYIALKIMGY